MTDVVKEESGSTHRRLPLLTLVIPLVLGIVIAAMIPRPVVGIIYLRDAIHAFTSADMIAQIRYAMERPEVRAVVLVIDSPGGTVIDTEAVYLELAMLRERKPVVTMAQGVAASGAYYLSVGTDYIFAGPSSPIGNVGVLSQLPPASSVFEDTVSTGPYKLFGSARDSQLRRMEAIKQAFYEAVTLGRGEALKIGPETLLRGEIWLGGEALRLGLVDELGSVSQAIQHAAEMAQVANYRVEDLREPAGLPPEFTFPFFIETAEGVLTPYPRQSGLYLLWIPTSGGTFP
ncbi:MAG: S49 family peptidase [Chloroflexi bacterium]|nr:S49 family peptidase [Chloroflexota bacterium]MCI0875870.1 S49 family peptidase [Chloroflexota bacterium]